MSDQQKAPFSVRLAQAQRLARWLAPVCETVKIAGSIRRRRKLVGDIELVAIPKFEDRPYGQADLLTGHVPMRRTNILVARLAAMDASPDHPLEQVLTSKGKPWGGDRYRRVIWEGVKTDLFLADRDNFGSIFLIRTGPTEFNRAWLERLKARGYQHKDGRVWLNQTPVSLLDEPAAFRVAGMRYIPTQRRDD